MCGIAGILNHFGVKTDLKKINIMLHALRFRGPDNKDFLQKKNISLLHTRLSIRDLSKSGNCPMTSFDNRYSLSFNGEIYNWRELKTKLIELGYVFKSNSDTEVVLNGYHAWNENVFNKLEGMFAIAIWDDITKTLFLAIDRFGEKPIYYHSNTKSFIFASNLNALNYFLDNHTINNESLLNYLSHGYLSKSNTIWKEINRLEPGTYLKIKTQQIYKIKKYWDLPKKPPKKINFNLGLTKVENLLTKSVTKCLDADVPVGVFLSGGVDSSLISAIAKKVDKKIKSFSLGYNESRYDESYYSSKVSKELLLNHHKVILDEEKAISFLPHLVKEYGQPFGDASALPTYFLSNFAKKNVKVCLSGDGGDELFGGYWRLQAVLYSNLYSKMLPNYLRKNIIPKISSFLGDFGKRLNSLNKLSLKSSYNSYTNSESWYDFLEEISGSRLKEHINKNKILSYRVGEATNINQYSLTQKILYDDIKTQFPYALLTKVDVASMSSSLEVRAPFLDKELVEYCWRLPDKTKVYLGERKKLLKKLSLKYLPKDVIYRKKMGFGIPLEEWFLKKLGNFGIELFRNSIAEELGYIKKGTFEKFIIKHKITKKETTRLWLLLWLELWFKQNCDKIN